MSHHFDTVALIGIGLIGSSISHATRRGGLARRIVGAAKTQSTRATALRLGLVDEVFASTADAVKEADLVILCVPVRACGPVAAEISGSLKPGAILTDVGSVKGSVLADVAPHARGPEAHREAMAERLVAVIPRPQPPARVVISHIEDK